MHVQLIDSMADDLNVVRSARVSTQGGDSLHSNGSVGLIHYLMRERHASPFEHNTFTWYVEGPIFVAREYMRHRMASYNEESGRYRELRPHFYYPTDPERPLRQVGQSAHYTFETAEELRPLVLDKMKESYRVAYEAYSAMLAEGVAREVARMVLPVGIYTSWYATMNARGLMNFLSLRTAAEAQWEIREIARKMEKDFARIMPITWSAWVANGRHSI